MSARTPLRRCVGCGEVKDKRLLLRVARTGDGKAAVDVNGRMQGRGAYVCRNSECLEKARKRRGFDRSYRSGVGESVYDELFKVLEGAGENER